MSHRIGFDPSLPLVSATEFTAGETAIKVGDTVDWKALGVTEQIAFDWWRSGMVSHPEGAVAAVTPAEAEEAAHVAEAAEAESLAVDADAESDEEGDESEPGSESAPRKPKRKKR